MSQANRDWLEGEKLADAGRLDEAEAAYRRALGDGRGHVPSLIGLSTVLSRKGRHREAHLAAMEAYAARPEDPALLYALGQRLRYFHEFAALEWCLTRPVLAARAPATVVARAVVMLSSIGAHQAAVQLADAGLARAPREAALCYVRGNLHFFSGEADDAERRYEDALRADPRLFQASWMLASVRSRTADNHHVPRLRSQLEAANPGGQGEAHVAYGLHKELHDLGDHEGAWEALARGNRVKRRHVDYDPDQQEAFLGAMVESYPGGEPAGEPVALGATPIFIVGMHRSGTTLMERILSGHPDVADAGETASVEAQLYLAADRAPAMGQPEPEFARALAHVDHVDVARRYARHVPWLSRGRGWFTEKLPSNFWHVGAIARAMPQARILHLVRDPLDTCFSNLRTLFAGVATYSYDQAELAHFYRQYRAMMAHWHRAYPGRVLDVGYDALVRDPDATARTIAAFCGLEFAEGMVDVARPDGRVSTASAATARQGILANRGRAWAPYSRHLDALKDGLAGFY